MNLAAARRLLHLKQLRLDRAESERRARQAALDQAVAAVDAARAALASWQEERPAKEAAIYDAMVGQILDRDDLQDAKTQVVALREHERLLEKRLEEREAEARQALKARNAAVDAANQARREVGKFQELIEPMRLAELSEIERIADLELEEFAVREDRAELEPAD